MYKEFKGVCDSLVNVENNNEIISLNFNTYNEVITLLDFKDEIRVWASTWCIGEEWVVEYLFCTFMVWYENKDTRNNLFLFNSDIGKMYKIIKKIQKELHRELPVYNFLFQTEKEYHSLARRLAAENIEMTNKAIMEEGYILTEEKRNIDHYTWFVHYHVFGWTYDEIADEYFIQKAATIGKVINSIYKTIGLNKENKRKQKILP
ncbi:hypothetical protein [Bacillus pinisoli]|uniref:hypothetical protein n=1 Tax=Bacillus pinisoli TaxID=2901866 RepID=UPI001FF2C29C|nr:hypothetical protein [Bacillus pinisoli]